MVAKKKNSQTNIELMMKNSVKKATNERLKKRIMLIMTSIPFMQLGYSKATVEKYKTVLRDSDVCIFFYYFEYLVKAIAIDPLCPNFDDIVKALTHFGLFEEESEEVALSNLAKTVLTVTPETLLHVWFCFANKLFKLADSSNSLEQLIEKRLNARICWFSLERKYFNTILISEPVVEAISKDISLIQKIYLFLRKGPELTLKRLTAEMHKYIQMYIRPVEENFLMFQALLSISDRKTEYQAIDDEETQVVVDINELTDLLIRIAYFLSICPETDLSLKALVCKTPNVKLYLDTEVQVAAKTKEIAQKFTYLVRGLDSYTNPEMQRMGMKELHTNLFIYTGDT